MIEKIVAVVLLIVLLPIIIIISLALFIEGILAKEARGPIFYTEERYSQGRPFNIYKFRTCKKQVLDSISSDEGIADIEKKSDNTTLIGHLLKKVYIDELPQIFNIIKGDIKFVGPRPLAYKFYKLHIDCGNKAKSTLKAGWTGPWQINKGRIKNLEDMVAVENAYMNETLQMNTMKKFICDCVIILKTFRIIIEAKSI